MKCSHLSSILLALPLLGAGEELPSGYEQHWDAKATPISLRCGRCHAKEYREWAGSDHAWAWRPVSEKLDASAFQGQEVEAHGHRLQMLRDKEGAFIIREANTGETFPVQAAIGRRPLVQYTIPWKDGGMQVPSAAWDSRKGEWFDVFRDDARQQANGTAERCKGDWGHWQGRGMNWDAQCAWCHMSGFHKNYQVEADRFQATWKEPGVTCIQCHRAEDTPAKDGCLVAPEHRKPAAGLQDDNCASCHARREELTDNFSIGQRFDDHFRLELPLLPGIFHPNGQQLEEDYCETSFRLSRMGRTGVTCYDCHNPHTGGLTESMENDQLCLQCHATNKVVNGVLAPQVKRSRLCGANTPNRCVDCHMPEDTYMGRDPRRDHSLHWPDPLLSKEIGLPNTCQNCHKDKDHDWAIAYLAKRYGAKMEKYRPRFRAVHAAMNGKGNVPQLLEVYDKEEIPAWRATILGLLARMPITPEVQLRAIAATQDADALVRAAAVQLLGGEHAQKALGDDTRVVRQAAGWSLFPNLPTGHPVLGEMEATARLQGDQPGGAMQLAMLASAKGDSAEAELQYKRAIERDPATPVARMDYAVFLARQNRLLEALRQMLACTAAHPENAEAQYRLALILLETGYHPAAQKAAEKALRLEPNHQGAQQILQYLRRRR